MGYSYNSNVYCSPENFGLSIIGELEYSDHNYQFHTRVFWNDDKGNIYSSMDSGCSCPLPFEDIMSIDDLEKIKTNSDIDYIKKEAQQEINQYSRSSVEDAMDLFHRISNMINNNR